MRENTAGTAKPLGWRAVSARLLLVVVVCLIATPTQAFARVIAVFKSENLAAYNAPIASFTKATDARVVTFDMEGDLAKGKQIAEQLAKVPPDLIFALGAKAAYSAKKYVTDVPIIYAMVINPEKYSLSQPNVTGITVEVPAETTFTQIRMFLPNVSRVGVIYSAATEDIVKRAERGAETLGIKFVRAQVVEGREVGDAFDRIKDSIDSLWMVPDSTALTPETFRLLLDKTRARKIPYLAYSENFVKAGALMSVSPDYETIGGQAALIAQQVLDGKVSPASIPPAPPVGTQITLNLDTARMLDLLIDPLVLAFADEIIGEKPVPPTNVTRP